MKLRTRYFKLKRENIYWSDTNCLSLALQEGEKYNKSEVIRVFKIVNKEDYGDINKEVMLEMLYKLNKVK